MNPGEFPDLLTMTLEEAKDYLLQRSLHTTGPCDLYVDDIAEKLLDAVQAKKQAAQRTSGRQVMTFTFSGKQYEEASYSAVLYDAAWELVNEGSLRPGTLYYGVTNARSNDFSLTAKGLERVGKKRQSPFL